MYLSVSCIGTAAVVDIESEPKHVLFVCFDSFSPLYICVVCLCFLFVFLHLVAVPASASPKHTSNRSSPAEEDGRRHSLRISFMC